MQEITVSAVQLDGVEADAMGAACGGGKCTDELCNLGAVESDGRRRLIAAGDG